MRAQASVGAALAALGQRIDVLARERQSLGLGARALELAAAIRDVLRSKDEIVPLAESFRRFFLKDLAARPMRSRRHPPADIEPTLTSMWKCLV